MNGILPITSKWRVSSPRRPGITHTVDATDIANAQRVGARTLGVQTHEVRAVRHPACALDETLVGEQLARMSAARPHHVLIKD